MNQKLFTPTGDVAVHVEAFIELAKLFFNFDITAIYLMGSYIDGTQVASSDLDFAVIYKDADPERDKAIKEFFDTYSRDYFKKEIDLYLISMDQIKNLEKDSLLTREGILNVKIASEIVYGKDIRDQIDIGDLQSYIDMTIATPLHFMQKLRGGNALIGNDLVYPREQDYFFGYLDHVHETHLGLETKPILTLIGWICTSRIALQSGELVGKKSDVKRMYGEYVNDEWTEYVGQAYDLIRNELAYRLPKTPAEKAAMRDLCESLLVFERAYIKEYEKVTK
jgi:predicted nucleotidyltransferase